MTTPWGEATAECPQCGEQAEPEEDGDVRFWVCSCGAEFGYQRSRQDDATCAAGLKISSMTPPGAALPGGNGTHAYLGTTIRRRPDDGT
jgi:hypothetical protein